MSRDIDFDDGERAIAGALARSWGDEGAEAVARQALGPGARR